MNHRLLILAFCAIASAQQPAPAPLALHSPVQDKNFYFLSTLERLPAVKQDPTLARIAAEKRKALTDPINALKWTDDEIEEVEIALRSLKIAEAPLRRSGVFIRYQSKSAEELVDQAWVDAARGINQIIDTYGAGIPPRYPLIDSVSFDVKSDAYRRLIQVIASVEEDDPSKLELFFQPSLHFALALLDANQRDEAGRLEPLETGENAAALRRIKTTQWTRFPYSAIVVPGAGTDRESISLGAWGKLRLALAAKRYRDGKAPFILVSGGYVHPNQTAHCEALEMKKSLLKDFGIPASAVIVEPHARHTTTNLRNAARLMYRYGMPFDRKALITTDQYQSTYIESPVFKERCIKELGYEPHALLGRTTTFDLAWTPRIDSLQFDSADPLDP